MNKKFSFSYNSDKQTALLTLFGLKLRIRLNISNKLIKKLGFIFKYFDLMIPKKNNRIVFFLFPTMENNALTFYKYLKQNHNNEFELSLIHYDKYKKYNLENCTFIRSFISLYRMYSAKYVVTTHDSYFLDFFMSKRHTYLNLWHGMPIKTLGFSEKGLKPITRKRFKFLSDNAHFFATSDIFKLSMISCFKGDYFNFHVTGLPRTDAMGDNGNKIKIKNNFNIKNFSKVVLYLPTWKSKSKARKQQVSVDFNNIFYMDDYNSPDFIKFLQDNNILFIMKPHPVEENFYKDNPDIVPQSKNFRILFDEELSKQNIDLYEIFSQTDLLISDYSSVTVDWLILNKPVLYLNNLSQEYGKGRGMVLEDNFELLMPGTKVITYDELKKEMLNNLLNDSYKTEREKALPLIHKYRDFKASERIYDIMKNL